MLYYKQKTAKNKYYYFEKDAELTANEIDNRIPGEDELLKEAEELMDQINIDDLDNYDFDDDESASDLKLVQEKIKLEKQNRLYKKNVKKSRERMKQWLLDKQNEANSPTIEA